MLIVTNLLERGALLKSREAKGVCSRKRRGDLHKRGMDGELNYLRKRKVVSGAYGLSGLRALGSRC